ncbi:MAG: IS1595 family transposase [Methylobacter sp.]|nr:IS1595 family transposase [Methylobacter sp.]
MELTDDQAFLLFKEVRWGEGSEVACPDCATVGNHYFLRTRKQWRCKDCNHTFSVTSGTIFAFHKLPLKVYLGAIAIYSNAVKGISALQLGRDLGVQYKTAFVMAHKIRESLMEQRDDRQLSGEIHMDGAYVNGCIRPKNKKEDRIDRRLAENQRPDKRCVFVMRQREEAETSETKGANKTLTFIIKSENQADVNKLATEFVKKGSVICADESNAYDVLHAKFDTRRVNHAKEYRSDAGITNNLAESYFSRFRRMQYGQTHKFGNLYLANYANEAAYREDTRRLPNGEIFMDVVKKCALTRTNRDWCGYWQGNKRQAERLAA